MTWAASLNLLKVIREDLLLEVRTAVHEAKEKDANARRTNLRVPYDGQTKTFDLEVIPISSNLIKERFFLVLFEEATLSAPPPGKPSINKAGTDKAETGARSKRRDLESEIARRPQELEAAQAYLRAARSTKLGGGEWNIHHFGESGQKKPSDGRTTCRRRGKASALRVSEHSRDDPSPEERACAG